MKNLIILLLIATCVQMDLSAQALDLVTADLVLVENNATTDKVRVDFTANAAFPNSTDINPINVWLKVPAAESGTVMITISSNPMNLLFASSFSTGGFFYLNYQSVTAQTVGTFPMGVPVEIGTFDVTGASSVELSGADFGDMGSGSNWPGTAMVQGTDNLLVWPIAGEIAALPINLRDFDVVKKGRDGAKLNWITSSEENSSHFDVERSVDGKSWSKIGEVAAAGNSFSEQYYTFSDANLKAIPNADNIFYYRLRSVDFDSKFDYSEIKNIELDRSDIAISVYPNPASEGIWIRSSLEASNREELSYTLVDITGRIVMSNTLGDAKEINEYISLDNTAIGTYMLNISSPNEVLQSEKVVVIGKE